MDTPTTAELKKNIYHNGLFSSQEQNKASQTKESDLSFDLNSIDLNDLDLEHSSTSSQAKNEDEKEAQSCCLGFWNWLCPKR
jgi:hypothetical protein